MSTITKYKINGIETEPYRKAVDVTIKADFGLEPEPVLSIDKISLVDTDVAKNSQKLRQLWADKPTEGADFGIEITGVDNNNNPISFDFDFYFDYPTMKFLSDVETEIGLLKVNSLESFNKRSPNITQQSLVFLNILNTIDFQPVPYVVENRKTLLERLQILYQTYSTIKAIADEVHKIINIASDLPTLGAPAAAINLTTTLTSIAVLFQQLFDLFQQVQESFFPPVLYHSGIKPKVFFEKAIVNYMGYDGVEFGNHIPANQTQGFGDLMDQLTWLGSKNNQKGVPDGFASFAKGPFNPDDPGYNLFDAKEIIKEQFRCREAIINNVYHLRPENDPFWQNQSGYVLPDLKIEQIFADNGTVNPNYDEANPSETIEYRTDDSDLWTLDDLADEADPNSTGKLISVKTIEPINVGDQKKIILEGAKLVNIPHALAVRKDQIDDLLFLFEDAVQEFNTSKQIIENLIDAWSSILQVSSPALNQYLQTIVNRTGAMKVENHYFSVPKQMLIENNTQGLPRIPLNFVDRIGAKALQQDYHSFDSFIPGQRNPNNLNQTAGKFVYNDVKIASFGLADFNTIQSNPYFTTINGEVGKFEKLDWNVDGDFAICTYWIYNSWLTNIEEKTA